MRFSRCVFANIHAYIACTSTISHTGSSSSDSESDPYVRFVILGTDGYLPTAVRTSVLKDTAHPVWPDTLTLVHHRPRLLQVHMCSLSGHALCDCSPAK